MQISEASLLFVDHPVGAGFSYVDSDEDFTTTMQEDADDLLELFRVFLQRHPGFRVSTAPLRRWYVDCTLPNCYSSEDI